MFRKLLLAATAVVVPLAAQAADITLRKDKTGRPMVVINGDIQFGDHDKFVKVAGRLPPSTIIALNSEGGVLIDALQIGHDIRNKRFWTVAGSVCASACAYIWLAGTERGAFGDSQIGFHNVYNANTNEATGAGNAVLGAYLTKLGFSYNTIIYMTSAKAAEMEWFSFEAAKKFGIKVIRLPGTKTAQPQPHLQPQQPPAVTSKPPVEYQWPPSPFATPKTATTTILRTTDTNLE